MAQESKCQFWWVEAWFIALSFQLFLSGESSHADWVYFGKRGLQKDDSGWQLFYLSFAGKERHLYLFYTDNSQNLPVDIPVEKRWHQQQRHYQQAQGITKEMWSVHHWTPKFRQPSIYFCVGFPGSFCKKNWKSTHWSWVPWHRTDSASIQSPWTSAAHVDFSWSCIPGHYNGHNSQL